MKKPKQVIKAEKVARSLAKALLNLMAKSEPGVVYTGAQKALDSYYRWTCKLNRRKS